MRSRHAVASSANSYASDIPFTRKEMTAFHSSTSGSAQPVCHSVFEFLASNHTPNPLQALKVDSLLPFQIPRQLCAGISLLYRTAFCFALFSSRFSSTLPSAYALFEEGQNMKRRGLTGLLAAAQLISSAWGAGTTIWTYVSYCPAPTTSLATGLGMPSGT